MKERGIQLGLVGLGLEEVEGLVLDAKEPTKDQLVNAHLRVMDNLLSTRQNPIMASYDWDNTREPSVSQQIKAFKLACRALRLPLILNRVTQHFDYDSGRITVDRLELSRRTPTT